MQSADFAGSAAWLMNRTAGLRVRQGENQLRMIYPGPLPRKMKFLRRLTASFSRGMTKTSMVSF